MGTQAETYYWTGSTDNFWGTLSNWNTNEAGSGTTPASFNATEDTVVINSGYVIMMGYEDNYKVKNIVINPGTTLYIHCNADFYNTTTITNNNGTLIIGNVNTDGRVFSFNSPEDCDFGKVLVSGNTKITINGNCTATSFQLKEDIEGNQINNSFTSTITGTTSDSLTITDNFNITSCSSDSNISGKLVIEKITINCNGTLTTNENSNLTIDSDATVTANTITGIDGSVTNNGTLVISNPTTSDLDVIDSNGSGTVNLAGEAIYIWTGNTSTVWTDDTNWQGGVPPDDAENIRIRNVASPAYLPEISSSVLVKEISFEAGAKLKVTGVTGIFTLNSNTSNFDISNIDPDSTGTVKTTGKFTVSTEEYTASDLKIECNTIDVTAALTANKLTIKDTTEFKANVTLDSFIASNLGGKTITLTNSDLTASNVTLTGSTGSLLSLKGPGTIKSVGTSYTSFSAEYLSIDNTIKLENYSNAIDNCEPTVDPGPATDDDWLAVIRNGWYIKALKNFTFTWTGNTDTSWNDGSNWDTGLVPEEDCKIIIPTGCTNYPELGSGSYAGGTLTLSSTNSKITLGAANLVLSGKENDTTATTTLSNAGTIILTGNGRITDGTNAINDITQGTVEYAADVSGTITDFDTGSGDDYYKLVIKGSGWKLGSSLKVNTITLYSNANCTLTSASKVQAQSFVFDGKFTSTYTLTLTPYSSSSDFSIPAGIANFSITGTNVWLYLGEDSTYTGNLVFDNALDLAYNIKLNGAASLNDDLQVSGSVTATDAISGTGTLIFTGNEAQQFTPTANKTYSNLKVDKSNETLAINNSNYDITNLTITNGTTVVSGDTRISNCAITKAASTSFNGTPEITTLTASANAGNISFNKGASITNNVSLSTTGTVTFDGSTTAISFTGSFEQTAGTTSVKGNVTAASFSAKNLVVTGDTAINTGIGGSQTYEIINGSTDSSENLTLTASTVTLKGNVGAEKSLRTLEVNAKLIIDTNGKQISASELDFSGDLDGSGKSLTIDAAIIKSTAASGTATITLNEIVFTKTNTSIQTQYATNIDFAVSKIIGNGKNLTLATSGTTRFTGDSNGDVEINPSLINSAGNTLTASAGEMTFKADLDLTSGSFNANGGTIILTAENKGDAPAVFNGGSKTFNNLTITGNAKIAGNNTIGTLTASNLGGKEITFTAGSSQSVTSMTLTGTDEDHKLWLSSDGVWNISCTNEPELRFLRVKNSTNNTSPATNFVAFKSTDAGNNTNWNFPDMKYIWLGNTSTVWDTESNWQDEVIPTKGATIEIQVSSANHYPSLTESLDLNTTLTTQTGTVDYNATITVFPGAEFNLNGYKITLGEIINNGQIKLNGNSADQITGRTTKGTETGANPTVEYTGTGTTTYFVWDDDNNSTNGKQYTNLILNRTGAEITEDLDVSNELTISAAASIANSKSISASGNVTSTANLSGAGKLIFTGTKEQNFTANGKTYSNLEKQGTNKLTINDIFTSATFVNTTGNGTIEFKDGATINSTLAFQAAASVILTGTLNSTNLTVANNFITSGAAIVDTTTTQNYNGNVTINTGSSLQLRNATDITFAANKTVSGNELNITSASNTIFNGTVELTKLSDAAAAGNIRFNAGGRITASAGQTFNTTSEVSFGNDNSDTFVIGTTTERNALTHTAGNTIINGSLTAGNITLADTTGGAMTLIGAAIILNGNLASTGTITITNSGLFKTADGKSISFTGSSPTGAGFTQNGSGNTMLGGSLTGTGIASFARHVYLYGSATAAFGSSGNTITIANGYNLITCRSGGTLSINAASVTADNIVFYKGSVNLNGNLFSRKDIVILGGTSYSTEDTSTGYEDEYAYDAPRPSGWSTAEYTLENQFPDTSSLSRGNTSFTIDSGKIIHVGKNFYVNGTTLSGSAEWFIDILSNANSHICFAEAYKSTITNCTVRLHDGTTAAGTSTPASAQIPTENCTLTGCSNFDDSPFTITEAYTTRDNVVYAKFNREVRNLNGELNGAVSNFKYHYSTDNDTSYSSIKINADGSTALGDGSEPYEIYLLSATGKTWNTDATGTNAGNSNSSDRNGNHKTTVPYIDIPRALGSGTSTTQNAVITDRFGKRLKNYSKSTTTSGYAYGTDTTVGNEYVLDKTGPVLTAVRTGQETHETNLASQQTYDSHNFIEFIYSEPVNFGDHTKTMNTYEWIPAYTTGVSGTENTPQNIQISDTTNTLGHVTNGTGGTNLTFAGLNQTIAAGKIVTASAGTITQTVNSFYRENAHSIKYSLAGYATNVSTDGTKSGSYINWLGYIESAEIPSGSVTGSATAAVPNSNVTDCALASDGTTPLYNRQIMNKPAMAVTPAESEAAGTIYGNWDTYAPVFVKGHIKGDAEDAPYFEAIGNGNGSDLTKLEIHIADNPSSSSSPNKIWLTRYGWSESTNPSSCISAAADNLVGGARPYASTNKTQGGLRYCTILNQENAFSYEIGSAASTSRSFTAIAPGAAAPFFTSSTSNRHEIPATQDNTYISLTLSDTNLPYKSTFTVSYNENGSYITDLAGNRLRSQPLMNSIDRTSPDFKISFSPVNSNKLLLIFVKALSTQIKYNQDEIPESFETIIPYCFELGTINSGSFTANTTGELQIDSSSPATILKEKSNALYTVIELTLTQNTSLDDLKNLYIRLKNAGTVGGHTYSLTSRDPLTGIEDSYVSFIQDTLGNYMQMYQAHALSDFAAGIINPLYAYNDGMEYDNENITQNLYEYGSWAVHDWNEEQNNYGTLLANKAVTVISSVDKTNLPVTGTGSPDFSLRMYYTTEASSGSVSNKFNSDLPENQIRLWMPDIAGFKDNGLFPAYSAITNSNYGYTDGTPLESTDISKGFMFNIDQTAVQNFNAGSQASFLFGLFNGSGNQESICLSPVLSISAGTASYNTSDKVPLYLIRLKNPSDITSLDLWSFKLKDITQQRGGVSILNNVIDAGKNEKTVIKVNLAEEGKLNVMVMTLDGNIITYLNRGTTGAGEHYFTWNGRNRNGNIVARGMYFIRVIGSGIDETRKVMVVK